MKERRGDPEVCSFTVGHMIAYTSGRFNIEIRLQIAFIFAPGEKTLLKSSHTSHVQSSIGWQSKATNNRSRCTGTVAPFVRKPISAPD